MVNIEIPDDEMRDLLSAQILSSLSQETRNTLVEKALNHLMVPDKSSYAPRETPIQGAFNRALQKLANQVADEVVAEHGVKSTLKDAMTKLLEEMPDIYTDWDLQTAILRTIIEHVRNPPR